MSHFALSSSLQAFFNQRGVDVERLTADAMIKLMVNWFRLAPIQGMAADTLLFRYGGWSEGCVTGFKFGLLRRVTASDETRTEWLAGITLMFEPSRYAGVEPLDTESTWGDLWKPLFAPSKARRDFACPQPSRRWRSWSSRRDYDKVAFIYDFSRKN